MNGKSFYPDIDGFAEHAERMAQDPDRGNHAVPCPCPECIAEAQAAKSEWCDASLKPKPGRGVLVWCPGNQCHYMAYWQDGRWKPWTPGDQELQGISAWRPVPLHPEFKP